MGVGTERSPNTVGTSISQRRPKDTPGAYGQGRGGTGGEKKIYKSESGKELNINVILLLGLGLYSYSYHLYIPNHCAPAEEVVTKCPSKQRPTAVPRLF